MLPRNLFVVCVHWQQHLTDFLFILNIPEITFPSTVTHIVQQKMSRGDAYREMKFGVKQLDVDNERTI